MTTPTSLIDALAQLNEPVGRCRVAATLDTRSPEEAQAFEDALAAKVLAGRRGTSYPALAKILSDVTGQKFTDDDVRHHAKKECRCE